MCVLFERFTERARQVVVLAREEACRLRHPYIGTEHILLGLLREKDGLGARTLTSCGLTLEQARAEIARIVGIGDEDVTGQIPFTAHGTRVLELSLDEALGLGHNYIGTEHILLGLVRQSEGVGFQVLVDLDADPEKIRAHIIRMVSGPVHSRDPGERGPNVKVLGPERTGVAFTGPAGVARGIARSPQVQRLTTQAVAYAAEDSRSVVDIPDVLLALTSDPENASLLSELGIDAAAVRTAIKARRDT